MPLEGCYPAGPGISETSNSEFPRNLPRSTRWQPEHQTPKSLMAGHRCGSSRSRLGPNRDFGNPEFPGFRLIPAKSVRVPKSRSPASASGEIGPGNSSSRPKSRIISPAIPANLKSGFKSGISDSLRAATATEVTACLRLSAGPGRGAAWRTSRGSSGGLLDPRRGVHTVRGAWRRRCLLILS